jgi:cysteine-rich repeat protein
MRSLKPLVAAAAVLVAACTDSGRDASDSHVGQTRQELHGPIPNVLVRLLNGQGHDSVVCNPLVKGLAPSLTSAYRTTITVTYPSAAIAQKVGTVTLASPSHVNNTNGNFALALLESPAGSGDYTVKAEFKRRTTERTDGIHRCEVQIDEDSDGDTVFETQWVNKVGEASHQATQSGPWHQSTSHRVSNDHVICQSRLNFADQSAIHYVDMSATTSAGTGSFVDIPFSPPSNPVQVSIAGGTAVIEWGVAPGQFPQPSLDVRFDFFGQLPGSVSSCAVRIQENDPGPTVLDGNTLMAGPGCGNGAVEDGEACDDGNGVSLDGCDNDCTFTDFNGNWSGVGEGGLGISFTVVNNAITTVSGGGCDRNFESSPIPIMPGGTFGYSSVGCCPNVCVAGMGGTFSSETNAGGTFLCDLCGGSMMYFSWTATRQ